MLLKKFATFPPRSRSHLASELTTASVLFNKTAFDIFKKVCFQNFFPTFALCSLPRKIAHWHRILLVV